MIWMHNWMKTFCNIQVWTLHLVIKQSYFAWAVKRPARIFGGGNSSAVGFGQKNIQSCSLHFGKIFWSIECPGIKYSYNIFNLYHDFFSILDILVVMVLTACTTCSRCNKMHNFFLKKVQYYQYYHTCIFIHMM